MREHVPGMRRAIAVFARLLTLSVTVVDALKIDDLGRAHAQGDARQPHAVLVRNRIMLGGPSVILTEPDGRGEIDLAEGAEGEREKERARALGR